MSFVTECMDERPGLIEVFMDAVRNNDAHKQRALEREAQKLQIKAEEEAETAKRQEFRNALEAHPQFQKFEDEIRNDVEALVYALAKSNVVPRVLGDRIIGSGYKIENGNIRYGAAGMEFMGHSKIFFECELSEQGFHITADNGLVASERGPALNAQQVKAKISEIASANGASTKKHFDEYKIHKGRPILHKMGLSI